MSAPRYRGGDSGERHRGAWRWAGGRVPRRGVRAASGAAWRGSRPSGEGPRAAGGGRVPTRCAAGGEERWRADVGRGRGRVRGRASFPTLRTAPRWRGRAPIEHYTFFSSSSCVTAVAPAGANTGACTAATECPCLYLCGSVTSVGVGATTMATEKYRKNKKEYAAGCRGQLRACASGLQVPQTANRGVCLAGPVLRSHDCHPKSTAIDGHHRCAIEGCIHLRRTSDSIQASRRIEGVTKGGIRRFCGH